MPTRQPFDRAAAEVTSLGPQDSVDPGTAIALAALVMHLPNVGQQLRIGDCTGAHQALAPGARAGRRDLEHGMHRLHR
ncbi:hypothetical protein XI07_04840 [Bradyrhizobium sp. CCBAU 11445]|nr:hypothetical protein [Bradyrhizobium sp. CCBAU 11445]